MTRGLYILLLVFCSTRLFGQEKIAGVLLRTPEAQNGYTLFSTVNSKITYLMDNCGRVVHTWESDYKPIHTLYLLPDGKLLRTAKLDNTVITGGGGGGRVELFDWDSNLLWFYEYNTDVVRMHHDVTALPNGNILILSWYLKTQDEALAAGRDPAKLTDGVIWSEQIIEIKPTAPGNGDIVWEWNAWDHLVQDFDNSKPNYDDVSLRPDRINLNYTPDGGQNDWIHANSLSYNPDLDQIIISTPFFESYGLSITVQLRHKQPRDREAFGVKVVISFIVGEILQHIIREPSPTKNFSVNIGCIGLMMAFLMRENYVFQ
ncbi:MAG: hypothetical protein HC811_07800 [Flammeovirgaceae bacterium]|nr:hypothetical protein [Flammeovirgaceae bacterium]